MGGPEKSSQWAGRPPKKSPDLGELVQEFPARGRSAAIPGPGWPKLPCHAAAADVASLGSRLGARLPSSRVRQHAVRYSRTLAFLLPARGRDAEAWMRDRMSRRKPESSIRRTHGAALATLRGTSSAVHDRVNLARHFRCSQTGGGAIQFTVFLRELPQHGR
jgi:hypothetical protein